MTEQQVSSEQPLAVDIDALLLGQHFIVCFFRDASHTLQMNQANSCSKCGCLQHPLALKSSRPPPLLMLSWRRMVGSNGPVLLAMC